LGCLSWGTCFVLGQKNAVEELEEPGVGVLFIEYLLSASHRCMAQSRGQWGGSCSNLQRVLNTTVELHQITPHVNTSSRFRAPGSLKEHVSRKCCKQSVIKHVLGLDKTWQKRNRERSTSGYSCQDPCRSPSELKSAIISWSAILALGLHRSVFPPQLLD